MELGALSGKTQPFAVLGHPIGHTLSPPMHNAAMGALGMDAVYLAFDVRPENLLDVLAGMQKMGFGGVNLTIPHKEVAFKGLEHLDATARLFGAVNTVQFLEDRLVGHTTDGYGFLTAHREAFDCDVTGDTILVLGAGGAGRTAALAAAQAGATALIFCDADEERARRISDETSRLFPEVAGSWIPPTALSDRVGEADLLVQATPVGMKPDDPVLLGAKSFREGQRLFDMVYMYPETGIMKEALAGGARAANGLGMLLHQGARSFEIWTGQEPAVEAMRHVLEERVYGT